MEEKHYKLLTPGPLSTSGRVKNVMLKDWCTWDNEYKELVQNMRKKILEAGGADTNIYTVVPMQGSGTFGVEAMIGSIIKDEDKLLILSNGVYGKRIKEIADTANKNYEYIEFSYDTCIDKKSAKKVIENSMATHVVLVHCETTTGILNNIDEIGELCKINNRVFLVDAMSSYGGIPIDFEKNNIAFLVSSSNKCIQGVPGFSFIICKKEAIKECKDISHSLSLNLYDQWEVMEKDGGKWRYTSPTHVVRAFYQALEELEDEGGITKRYKRYSENQKILSDGMKKLGFKCLIPKNVQSPVITTFHNPENEKYNFYDFYDFLKKEGFVIYPGSISGKNIFRIGNIGDIKKEDMEKLLKSIEKYTTEVLGWKN